mmetsp:Transcript_9468/g.14003  ORF Transcript_9468/g.14003 Transcript_9468/m.14003 type:complete len:402 (+) Transcript_9468:14-1219(+)
MTNPTLSSNVVHYNVPPHLDHRAKPFNSRSAFIKKLPIWPLEGGTLTDYLITSETPPVHVLARRSEDKNTKNITRSSQPFVHSREKPRYAFHPEYNVHEQYKHKVEVIRHNVHDKENSNMAVDYMQEFDENGQPLVDLNDDTIKAQENREIEEALKKAKVVEYRKRVQARVRERQDASRLSKLNKKKKINERKEKLKAFSKKVDKLNAKRFQDKSARELYTKEQLEREKRNIMLKKQEKLRHEQAEREAALLRERIPDVNQKMCNRQNAPVPSMNCPQPTPQVFENGNEHNPSRYQVLVGDIGKNDDQSSVISFGSTTSGKTTSRAGELAKEQRRYIEALRLQFLDKVREQNLEIPPLCSCGLDPFDDHPKLCCNNCQFYKNPKRYTEMIGSLLYSYGIVV